MAEQMKCAACGKPATMMCARCMTVGYCSRECQRTHWAIHRKVCVPYQEGPVKFDPEVDVEYLGLAAAVKEMYTAHIKVVELLSATQGAETFPKRYEDTVFAKYASAMAVAPEFVTALHLTMHWMPMLAELVATKAIVIDAVVQHSVRAMAKLAEQERTDGRSPREKLLDLVCCCLPAYAAMFDNKDPVEADIGRRGVWFIEAIVDSLSKVSEHVGEEVELVAPRFGGGGGGGFRGGFGGGGGGFRGGMRGGGGGFRGGMPGRGYGYGGYGVLPFMAGAALSPLLYSGYYNPYYNNPYYYPPYY